MINYKKSISNTYQYMWKDIPSAKNWTEILKIEPENTEINSEEYLLKSFNNLILSNYDMKTEEYDFSTKKKIKKNMQLETYENKINEEIKNFFLLNSNLQCFSYYKLNKRNKLQFFKDKKKIGFNIQQVVLNKKYDDLFYLKKVNEILSAIEVKKKVF